MRIRGKGDLGEYTWRCSLTLEKSRILQKSTDFCFLGEYFLQVSGMPPTWLLWNGGKRENKSTEVSLCSECNEVLFQATHMPPM